MRLGQLSRKLEVDSSAIVELLKQNFREVNNHPNIKISKEELAFITNHFEPTPEPEKEPQPVTEEIITEPTVDIKEEPLEEEKETEIIETPAFVESLRPKVITLEEEFNAKKKELETFKAEKPELEGLRVVGKIDLPEPKPKAVKETKEVKEEKSKRSTQTIDERGARQRHNKRKSYRRNSNRNPVESQRKRAELEAKKKKEQEQQWHKEQKKKHYEQNVKAKIADKPKKKKKKKFVEQQAIEAQVQQTQTQSAKPTNVISRFWRWLNGGYDKFD